MMFANLMKGSPVFVLDARETPKYYMATLEDAPQPYFPRGGQYAPSQPSVIFPVNGQDWVVPVNADMATREGVTVTTSRERFMDAVTARRQQSQNIVASYDREKANLEAYDQIMRDVNPACVAPAPNDGELASLREELRRSQDEMAERARRSEDEMAAMKAMLADFINSQKSPKTSKS